MTFEFADAPAPPATLRLRRVALVALALLTFWHWQQTGAELAARQHEMLTLFTSADLAGLWLAGGQLASNAFEALAYVLLWRLAGVRLQWLPLAIAIFAASLPETLAWRVVWYARDHDAHRLAAALLAGPRALWDDGERTSGLSFAFAGTGLLALLRLAWTAEAQARGGAPRARACLFTLLAWLALRIAAGLASDLVRGL